MRSLYAILILILSCGCALAGTTTTNYSLYKPAKGDTDWSTQVNNNFDTIDSTMKATSDVANTAVTPSELTAAIATKVDDADLGVANGVATLGADSKLTATQLPAALVGALIYKGVLDASGAAYPADPEQGWYYVISVAGTIDGTAYIVGDWAAYNGTSWDKIDNSASSSGWSSGGGVVKLLDDGNDVGIGTDTPTSELDVVGTVTATAFAGPLTGAVTGNASTATTAAALTANGANCSAGSYPLGVGADGAVESCTDATTEIDSAITTHAAVTSSVHGAVSTNTASRIVTRDASGNFAAGTITATLTGNASTATALAANPTDCATNQYANSIAANGNLTCSTPPGSITGLTTNYITKAASATSIADSSILDNGSAISTTLNITAPTFIGALTGNASTATALAANGTNCAAGEASQGVDASGNAESCFAPGGWATDNSTKTTTTYLVGIGDATPDYNLDVVGTIGVDGAIYGERFVSTLTTDRSIYGSSAKIGFAQFGTYVTSIEGITAGTSTPVAGTAVLAVDGSIYTTTGSIGVKTASPAVALDVVGQVRGKTFTPYVYPALTAATNSLTSAIMATADVFYANTTSNAVVATMYSDVADNGIPSTDLGRTIQFYLQTVDGSADTLTVAADADLTLTTVQAITAGGLIVEDVGDHIDCTILTTDHIVCTTYEAD